MDSGYLRAVGARLSVTGLWCERYTEFQDPFPSQNRDIKDLYITGQHKLQVHYDGQGAQNNKKLMVCMVWSRVISCMLRNLQKRLSHTIDSHICGWYNFRINDSSNGPDFQPSF